MNRDEFLEKLAMELAEWPKSLTGVPGNISACWCFERGSCREESGVYAWATRNPGPDDDTINVHEWLAERERLINRPNWGDAPEWADWLCQQATGLWCWYSEEPERHRNKWHGGCMMRMTTASEGAIPAGHDWRQTLEQRPAFTTSLGASGWDEDRIDIIGSNGATGEHYSSEPACSCGSVVGEYHSPECSEVNAFQAGRINSADEAPAWNGEGLPPIGAECEIRYDDGCSEWTSATIRYISGNVVVWQWDHQLGSSDDCCTYHSHGRVDFRPIRSDEDRAVDEMLGGSGFEGGVVRALCRALYRAGYRKLEAAHE